MCAAQLTSRWSSHRGADVWEKLSELRKSRHGVPGAGLHPGLLLQKQAKGSFVLKYRVGGKGSLKGPGEEQELQTASTAGEVLSTT